MDAQPRVTEVEDNVQVLSGDSTPEVIAAAKLHANNNATTATTAPTTEPPTFKLFTLAEAINLVATNSRRNLETVKLRMPHHIYDGAVIDFVDIEADTTIGAAKIFVQNLLLVDKEGKISVEIMLGEVSVTRRTIVVNLGQPPAK